MDEVEEVKRRLEVAEVVGGYIQLKQSGRNLKASCPFHHEKTASFMVSPEKGIWHCFGCGEGGDIFKFVMMMEGVEFKPALEQLARRAGIELQSRGPAREQNRLKERLLVATEWAVKYYQASLVKNPKALEYAVKRRRLSRDTIKAFQFGYAPDSWSGLTQFLAKKGFSEAELLQAGLVGKKHSIYDLFRGRLMLTIGDGAGRPIGFTGRVLGDDEPKYLNTPQTPLYDKSQAIYGLHLAKPAIRETGEVILVEGNMDVIASHQAGVGQVVAASGTALTIDQLKTLSRLTKNIKLAFDQDKAGLAATERAIELSQKLGLSLKMITISAKDPDELIEQDPGLWRTAIAQAKYIIDYLFERCENEYDLATGMGKRQYSDRLALNLQRLADPVEQDHYVRLLADKIGSSLEAVKQKIEQTSQHAKYEIPSTKSEAATRTHKLKPADRDTRALAEETLLALALAYPPVRRNMNQLSVNDFSHPDRAAMAKVLLAAEAATADQVIKALPSGIDYAKILTLRGEEEFASLAPADRSLESIRLSRRLQTLSQRKSMKDIQERIRQAQQSGDKELERALLSEFQNLISP